MYSPQNNTKRCISSSEKPEKKYFLIILLPALYQSPIGISRAIAICSLLLHKILWPSKHQQKLWIGCIDGHTTNTGNNAKACSQWKLGKNTNLKWMKKPHFFQCYCGDLRSRLLWSIKHFYSLFELFIHFLILSGVGH